MVSATTKILSHPGRMANRRTRKKIKENLGALNGSFQSEEKVRIVKILVIAILFEQWRRRCNVIKPVFSDLLELEGS